MKTITVNVSEPVYRDFQAYARRTDRKAAELIREAMEQYCRTTIQESGSASLHGLRPLSLGKVREGACTGGDWLGEMTEDL